jgi:hypothetical protein
MEFSLAGIRSAMNKGSGATLRQNEAELLAVPLRMVYPRYPLDENGLQRILRVEEMDMPDVVKIIKKMEEHG